MPWGVQEKLGGDPSTYMMVLEGEQELVRCEKLWFRRKKKNIGHTVERKERQDKLVL